MNLQLRNATTDDLDEICEIEKVCFPVEEAASHESFSKRLAFFPDRFWLLCDNNKKIVSFVNGMLTDEADLSDEMYDNAEMHNKNGSWQIIFGVDTLNEYQHNGYASLLLKSVVEQCRREGRLGVVLTCKEKLLGFYQRLGFVNEGVSPSCHGGSVWYQMRISFSA